MAQRHGKDARECTSVPVNEYSLYTIEVAKEKENKLGFEISVFCGFFLHAVHNPESPTTISYYLEILIYFITRKLSKYCS